MLILRQISRPIFKEAQLFDDLIKSIKPTDRADQYTINLLEALIKIGDRGNSSSTKGFLSYSFLFNSVRDEFPHLLPQWTDLISQAQYAWIAVIDDCVTIDGLQRRFIPSRWDPSVQTSLGFGSFFPNLKTCNSD